jgi:hypothetical protein
MRLSLPRWEGDPVMGTRTNGFNNQGLCIPCLETMEKKV